MPSRAAHLDLARLLDDDDLLAIFRPRFAPPLEVDAPPAPGPDDWEALEDLLFADQDGDRGHGSGFYAFDAEEAASRRVDLRGPSDHDPGPIPLEEAEDDEDVVVLDLGGDPTR